MNLAFRNSRKFPRVREGRRESDIRLRREHLCQFDAGGRTKARERRHSYSIISMATLPLCGYVTKDESLVLRVDGRVQANDLAALESYSASITVSLPDFTALRMISLLATRSIALR